MKLRYWPVVMSTLFCFLPETGLGQTSTCDPDNAGLTLPPGFCAGVFADGLGRARHLTVAENGDVYVAISGGSGGALLLRDTNRDGRADQQVSFGDGSGSDVELRNGYIYYSSNSAVRRYRPDSLGVPGEAQDIVVGMPSTGGHFWGKSLAFLGDTLIVNIGSATNSCQIDDRQAGSPGRDPCTELETRAGLWAFDADGVGQSFEDGNRYSTGMRNTIALAVRPQDGHLYAAMHGRDQLMQSWGNLYQAEQSAELPSEEFIRIELGDNFGWPYCYYDHQMGRRVLNPEYGGDASKGDRCRDFTLPLVGFPGHWAPDGILFYSGASFPARYRGGAFIAFHGSWNRAPLPQQGYNVVFVPFAGNAPTGEYEVFADGFRDEHRPVGVAMGPDGSIYISDDRGGRIYRISYQR